MKFGGLNLCSERDSDYVPARGWKQTGDDDEEEDDDDDDKAARSPEDKAIVNQLFEKTLEEYDDDDIGDVEDVSFELLSSSSLYNTCQDDASAENLIDFDDETFEKALDEFLQVLCEHHTFFLTTSPLNELGTSREEAFPGRKQFRRST